MESQQLAADCGHEATMRRRAFERRAHTDTDESLRSERRMERMSATRHARESSPDGRVGQESALE